MTEEKHEVVRALDPEPARRSWNQRDATIVHGLDLLWRGLLGLIAGLIGGALLYAMVASPPASFRTNRLAEDVASLYTFAWLGAGLMAFAAGQALQIFFVGGDQGFDQRLWERLTPAERGAWQLREGAAGRKTFRLFLWLGVATTVWVDVRVARMAWTGSGVALAALAMFGFNLAAVLAAAVAWRLRARSPLSGAMPVSQGRWTVEVRDDPRGLPALYLFIGALVCGHFALQAVDGAPRDRLVHWGWSGAGLAVMAYCTWRLFRLRHAPQPLKRRLQITRKTDHPLVLECTATLPLPLEDIVGRPWLGRFAGYYGYSSIRTDKPWDRWLDVVAAPLWVDRHTGEVHVRFEVPQLRDLPARPIWWRVQFEIPPGTRPVFEFDVPREVVFPEELGS